MVQSLLIQLCLPLSFVIKSWSSSSLFFSSFISTFDSVFGRLSSSSTEFSVKFLFVTFSVGLLSLVPRIYSTVKQFPDFIIRAMGVYSPVSKPSISYKEMIMME